MASPEHGCGYYDYALLEVANPFLLELLLGTGTKFPKRDLPSSAITLQEPYIQLRLFHESTISCCMCHTCKLTCLSSQHYTSNLRTALFQDRHFGTILGLSAVTELSNANQGAHLTESIQLRSLPGTAKKRIHLKKLNIKSELPAQDFTMPRQDYDLETVNHRMIV